MKRILLLFALVAGIAIAWLVVSPTRAVEGLRDAVVAHDTAALNELIAFDSVRTNLKTDLRDQLARTAGTARPGVALGMAIGALFVDGMIDMFVSPMGLAIVLSGRLPDDDLPAEAELRRPPDYTIDRLGLDRFAVHFEDDEDGGARPVLEFRRDGLNWRMVRIRIENPARSE